MALNKVINDANQKFEPVTTETLVFDTVPTEGSFNAVTSDGVAKAIAEGGGGGADIFYAEYGVTTWQAIFDAHQAGKVVVLDKPLESGVAGYQLVLSSIFSSNAPELSYAEFQQPMFGHTSTYPNRVGFVVVYKVDGNDTWSQSTKYAVPNPETTDQGKVLAVTDEHSQVGWVTPSGGASYTAGAGISINNDTISVNHDNSLSDVAGSLSVEINGMARTFKILPNASLTMDDTLTISISSTSWAGVGIAQDNIPGYLRVKLTSVDDSSKYVISTINCRKNNDEIYLDSVWSPYGLAGVTFDTYESAPLSYAFNWGSLTLADLGLTSGNGVYVTLAMCDSNGGQLGNDLSISGLSSSACTVGSTAAPQKLSVATPVPSTNMVSSGSVLTVGSTGQPEWAAPSGGGAFWAEYNVTSYADIAAAYAAGKTVIMSPFYSNQLCAYLMYIDSTIATFMCIDTNVNVASVNRFMVYAQSGSWANDTFTAVPYYDSTTDEGKILKIVSGVPTWVTP